MNIAYKAGSTGLLLLDPYNDFLSDGGLLWPRVKEVAMEVGLLENLRSILASARAAKIQVFYVPHRQWQEGNYENWQHMTSAQRWSQAHKFCAKGSWGGEFREEFAARAGDVIVKQHWGSSGFANTDLDFQLKQHRITHVILVGLIANTCIEATGRFASELGFHVTLVRDATAAYTMQNMHSAHEVNGPTYAHAIVKTRELLASFPSAEKL